MFDRRYISFVPAALQIVGEALNRETLSIANKEYKIFVDQSPSVSRMPLSQKFANLAATWKAETQFTPSIGQMVSNHAYMKIIGMGQDATPLLIKELDKQPDHWFPALVAITGVDPVAQEDKGDISAMAQAWVRWGKRHGYY